MGKLKPYHGFVLVAALMLSMVLSGCYQHGARNYRLPSSFHISERLIDSLSFFSTHHYTNNYNFVVKADSLQLIRQFPEETLSGVKASILLYLTFVLSRPIVSILSGYNWLTIRRLLGGAGKTICFKR